MSYEQGEEEEILTSDKKGIESARDELTWLFRNILQDLQIGPMPWEKLMEKYLNDPANNVPINGRDRSSIRGNLNKALLKSSTMTWKFFKIGLRFLGAIHFTINFEITWQNNRTSNYSGKVILVRQPQIKTNKANEETNH